MNYPDDTIAAISTPIGQGGIGIVRLSGPSAIQIAGRIFRPSKKSPGDQASFALLHGHVIDPQTGTVIDEALLGIMRAPRSYTREDVAEISCHGGMMSVKAVLELALMEGARLAEPGEFTKRAFLNGRISLAEAEAVADIIAARTDESRRVAVEQLRGSLSQKLSAVRGRLVEIAALSEAHIDFPEEEIGTATTAGMRERVASARSEIDRLAATFDEARFFREGLAIAIVGRPNVGKSSLLNRLLEKERAIVTEIPGTTRDVIEDSLNIRGLPVRIMDTAGIRQSGEMVEKEGIRRSLQAIEDADVVIVLLDGSTPLTGEDREILAKTAHKKTLVAINKSDLPRQITAEEAELKGRRCLRLSALTGAAVDDLKVMIHETTLSHWPEDREGVVVTNLRHRVALEQASAALERANTLLSKDRPLELFAIELRDAIGSIGEITGAVTTDEILERIFSTFCIGK